MQLIKTPQKASALNRAAQPQPPRMEPAAPDLQGRTRRWWHCCRTTHHTRRRNCSAQSAHSMASRLCSAFSSWSTRPACMEATGATPPFLNAPPKALDSRAGGTKEQRAAGEMRQHKRTAAARYPSVHPSKEGESWTAARGGRCDAARRGSRVPARKAGVLRPTHLCYPQRQLDRVLRRLHLKILHGGQLQAQGAGAEEGTQERNSGPHPASLPLSLLWLAQAPPASNRLPGPINGAVQQAVSRAARAAPPPGSGC